MIFSRIVKTTILISLVLNMIGCGNQKNADIREIQKQISQSEKLKKLDQLCRNFPVFEDLEPEILTISRKSDALFYYYKMKPEPKGLPGKIKEHLLQNGWNLTKEARGTAEFQIEFEKENYWIQIGYHEFTELNYSINCKDLSISR